MKLWFSPDATCYWFCESFTPRSAVISEILGFVTTPIPGANPLGENINFDATFDTLKTEIGKLGNVDYALVQSSAVRLITEKSKDLRVVAFLSLAYLRDENWESFADLFEGVAKLADPGYDALFPERPNAKVNAFKWMMEPRYLDTLAEKKPQEKDHPHILRLIDGLGRLKAVMEPKYPEGSPFPTQLLSEAQKWEKACKPKPKEEKPASAPGAATPGAFETPKQAQDAVRKTAMFLIEKEPLKPMGYRLLRASRWDPIEKSPPVQEGKTQVPGPNPQQRVFFQNLCAQKEWTGTIAKIEGAFAAGGCHVWLDLQRIGATACKELGDANKAVRDAIIIETALLLKRVPELPLLNFADGTSFCDDATKAWIAAEVITALASGNGAPAAAGGADDLIAQERRAVADLSAAGQFEGAVELLQEAMLTSKSERDNFNRSIQIGNLLLKGKQPDIALSFLESIGEKIEEYHLDKWDPDLAIEAWGAMYGAYKIAKGSKPPPVQAAMGEKQAALLGRISRINPKKALSLNK